MDRGIRELGSAGDRRYWRQRRVWSGVISEVILWEEGERERWEVKNDMDRV